jgi:hypothetical protein
MPPERLTLRIPFLFEADKLKTKKNLNALWLFADLSTAIVLTMPLRYIRVPQPGRHVTWQSPAP